MMRVFGYSTGTRRRIVAARSLTAASVLFDESRSLVATYGSETFNPAEVALANSAPGTVFWHTQRGALEGRMNFQPETKS